MSDSTLSLLTLDLLKPDLYGLGAAGTPTLLGGRCECGYVFFPMQTFGCEIRSGAASGVQGLARAYARRPRERAVSSAMISIRDLN